MFVLELVAHACFTEATATKNGRGTSPQEDEETPVPEKGGLDVNLISLAAPE